MSEKADQKLIKRILNRVSTNLAMLIDREIEIAEIEASREHTRPAGEDQVHISFRLRFTDEDGGESYGSILVPLPDAISMACFLMMVPDAEVSERRKDTDLDQGTKDAMLEVGNFIGAAVEEVCREVVPGTAVHSAGCQGVRKNVRPAFPYEEGDELLVGRAQARIHTFPEFELILMMPAASLQVAAA
ncbi:MAG TPA: hypothetical protein ENJ09_07580 [Planctomycetes bacterium]|nr:hypothetical protein [Planctomycetota bacterium]